MLNKKLWLGVALSYTLLLFVACLATVKVTIAQSFEHKDKIVHIGIYIVYTLVWFIYFNFNQKKANYKKVVLFAFATGVLIELLQGAFTQNRSADVLDVVANSIGIAIAATLLKYFYAKVQKNKSS